MTLRHWPCIFSRVFGGWGWGGVVHGRKRKQRLQRKCANLVSRAPHSLIHLWHSGIPWNSVKKGALLMGFYELVGNVNPLKMLTRSIWLPFNKEGKGAATWEWILQTRPFLSTTYRAYLWKRHFLTEVSHRRRALSSVTHSCFQESINELEKASPLEMLVRADSIMECFLFWSDLLTQ